MAAMPSKVTNTCSAMGYPTRAIIGATSDNAQAAGMAAGEVDKDRVTLQWWIGH